MTQSTPRHSDRYVWPALIGFIGMIGLGVGSDFIPNVKSYGNEIAVALVAFLVLFIVSMIQVKRLDKKQCSQGQHNPDDLRICRDCHTRLEGSEDLIDQHSRDLDRQLSKKSGKIKFIGPPIVTFVFMTIFGYWLVTSSHAALINEINSMNATDPQSCLYLIKQKDFERGPNILFIGSHVVKATNLKWNELNCAHKPIMDDLNQTCPIGVIPTLQGLNGYLCYANENQGKINK